MSYIQLPLLKKNNQTFGFCKDKKFFYIIINFVKNNILTPANFEFSLNDINGEYYISDLVKKDTKEDLFCALTDIN